MLILKIKDPKIEKMLGEILMRTKYSSPEEYLNARIRDDQCRLVRGTC